MEHHVIPFATFELRDEVTAALKSRLVKAVLQKYVEPLRTIFSVYAKADGGGASTAYAEADGGSASMTMNLGRHIRKSYRTND